ncbi:hypothetical protein PCYB_111070 [Plasmodium cynomolgi strain B]|uniref:Uncharacterized protein n=1 Tax=Plasmodium cynomolgi (strain B) TaxID=1120755 RepID=K6UDS0_PLACD|nr:hypothetical protein PCYB_111070 [Plasmodium cynomolgi strain B]GAB67086.1 hypothetical protein PCYB_111070 [Plasmodium cynomolgi strain B]
MDDSFGSKLDVTLDEKTKNVDDVIPVPEDDASSMQSSIPSLIKDADSYVRGLFSGIMNPSSDDDSSVADGKKEKKEDEEEEEEKPLLVSMKDAFTSLFDKRGVAILLLLFLVGCVVYMHKHGYLANFKATTTITTHMLDALAKTKAQNQLTIVPQLENAHAKELKD